MLYQFATEYEIFKIMLCEIHFKEEYKVLLQHNLSV